MIQLEQVRLDRLEAMWPVVEPDLARTCDAVLTTWTPPGIKAAIEGGELALFVVHDGDRLLGALTVGIKSVGNETAISFVHLGGREMDTWLDLIVEQIEALGKSLGATLSEIEGRPGWAPLMRRHGYATARVVLHKVL